MDTSRIIREIMVSGKTYTTKEIVDIIKSDYTQEWAEKQKYYLNGGKDEVYVYNQIRAEVGSTFTKTPSGWMDLSRVTREKNINGIWAYTITPEYQKFLQDNQNTQFINQVEESLTNDELVDEEIYDECDDCPKDYYVYLMKSDEFDNTYKIGFTDNLERRPKELNSPSNKVYNIFNFYVKMWVKLSDKKEMMSLENTLHDYFHRNRKYKKNGSSVDTEIFVNSQMESMFKRFILKNYIEDEYQKGVVVEHNMN